MAASGQIEPAKEFAEGVTLAHYEPGAPTSTPANITYRLGKLGELGLLHGLWLDCGCADGGYTAVIAGTGVRHVVGIDVGMDRLVRARARTQTSGALACVRAAVEALPFPDDTFDGVFLNEVLEHVTDEPQTLREIRRVLRPGGHLALISPNRWFPFEGHGMRTGGRAVDVPVPFLPWIPARLAAPLVRARNYWPGQLTAMVRAAGFEVAATAPVFPVFETYPWLPAGVIRCYRRILRKLERMPIIRRFGVSTLVLARCPGTLPDRQRATD